MACRSDGTLDFIEGRECEAAQDAASAGAKKRMHEAKLEVAGCTFAPTTGRGPQQGARAEMASLPPSQRLYQRVDDKWTQVGALQPNPQWQI